MAGFGGGQLEHLRQWGTDRRQASPEQAQEGRAGALPELRFDHAAAPATLARSEKSRTCSKSHGKLDPPWRSPDGPPCTGARWSDAARCGASISRVVAASEAAALRAHREKLPNEGSRLRGGGGGRKAGRIYGHETQRADDATVYGWGGAESKAPSPTVRKVIR